MRSSFTSRSFAALTIVVIAAALLAAVWDRHGAGIAAQGTPSCVAAPAGLVNWWPGDGHTLDTVDAANGALFNGATFVAGKVGQAFSFDGVDDYVQYGADMARIVLSSLIPVRGISARRTSQLISGSGRLQLAPKASSAGDQVVLTVVSGI